MRLIDADALMKILGITDMYCDKCAWWDKEWNRCKRGSDFEDACCAIENAPTIKERKRGKWECGAICSVCGERWDYYFSGTIWVDELPNFCPNCGADMRGETNE